MTKESSIDDDSLSRIDLRSPSRLKDNNGAFASTQLINAKLERIQGKGPSENMTSKLRKAPFESIEESKDPNNELTMSKIDSIDLQSSSEAHGQNSSGKPSQVYIDPS